MDPTVTLQEIRARMREIDIFRADWESGSPTEGATTMVTLGFELAELIEALDIWIKNGGFLPAEWQAAQDRS